MALDFAALRLRAVTERPYFGVALCALTPVSRPGHRTFSVDNYGRLYWDPQLHWSVEQAAWVLIHELQHWLRDHHARALPYLAKAACPECEAKKINEDQDAEINDDLRAERANLPGSPFYPETLGQKPGLFWEQYYEARTSSGGGHGHHCHDHGDYACGSGAHGLPQDYEEPAGNRKVPAFSPAEAELLRDQVAREVLAHAERGIGNCPAGLLRWAKGRLTPPQVPWERQLLSASRTAVTLAAGAVDYCYTRPSRRGPFAGILMPSMVRPIPHVAVVLDTSGSMGTERELPAALAEIPGIVRALGQRHVPVICCDAAAAAVQHVNQIQHLKLYGGGGTNMGEGLTAASKKLRAQVAIVLTDGYTPWPDYPPPGMQVVVGLIGNYNREMPRWARVVRIKIDKAESPLW